MDWHLSVTIASLCFLCFFSEWVLSSFFPCCCSESLRHCQIVVALASCLAFYKTQRHFPHPSPPPLNSNAGSVVSKSRIVAQDIQKLPVVPPSSLHGWCKGWWGHGRGTDRTASRTVADTVLRRRAHAQRHHVGLLVHVSAALLAANRPCSKVYQRISTDSITLLDSINFRSFWTRMFKAADLNFALPLAEMQQLWCSRARLQMGWWRSSQARWLRQNSN